MNLTSTMTMAGFGVIICLSVALMETASAQDTTCSEVKKVLKDMQETFCKVEYEKLYRDCAEVQDAGNTENGVYTIQPKRRAFPVYCDLTTHGGGWTVFQRRLDGSVDFYRNYSSYEGGFGQPHGEYWLGLKWISKLAKQENQELRVDLEDWEGEKRYAQYSNFSVGDANVGYNLTVAGYSGNAGDGMSGHSGARFTTQDNDQDIWGDNCAVTFKGAWWYTKCHSANLNGFYFNGGAHTSYADGVDWSRWKGYYYSLKKTQMKMRPAGFGGRDVYGTIFNN